ncbi:MAG: HAD-IC family P-type ATPase [Gammaproteobacteria bacterium]|nr:HAD-IC family P-type ATPase [Gammaproteobacteria bacterium]
MNDAPGSNARAGLSSEEARARLGRYGPNSMPEERSPLWRRALAKFSAPVPWMLEAAILLELALGERIEAAVIAVLLCFNAALGLLQEGRAKATLEALKARLALQVSVRRDGAWQTLSAETLVPGDLVKLDLGGVVPADVELLEGSVLLDQSMLTGESLPVEAGPGAKTFAGALVRRGAAFAEVGATGTRTRFGRTAELVRVAHGRSSQQEAVLRVVRNLGFFSAAMVLVQLVYATATHVEAHALVPLVLTAILAAIPVALPATFTLAAALGAAALAREGALATRLSAIDEAANMDVLCSDKTGTLTQNRLEVADCRAAQGYDGDSVLRLAALASAESGFDPVDGAIRAAAAAKPAAASPLRLVHFEPFDPARRTAEARAIDLQGRGWRIVKGAFATLDALVPAAAELRAAAQAMERDGRRVLGVVAGPDATLSWVGLIGLSDPPRDDAAQMIAELGSLGVRTVMITGDSPATAAAVAARVGLTGPVRPPGALPERVQPGEYAVFAGVFPEDKFHLVRAFQSGGHTVGMCGDGANDAPALRQAQIGIAVSTATDIAKSAAGIVLTQPGLGGILATVRCGRITYQRILTYTLRSVTAKIHQMLFLTVGLLVTGRAVLTPMLMVLLMVSGDFLAMSATTDRVQPSPRPAVWSIGRVTAAAALLGSCNLGFCIAVLLFGRDRLGMTAHAGLRTLAAVTLVCVTQASFYVVRERRRWWASRPSAWVLASTALDLGLITLLASRGILVHRLPIWLIGAVAAGAFAFMCALDLVKGAVFRALAID